MIEHSEFENDLVIGAVWRSKTKQSRLAKISSVWFQRSTGTTCVGYYLWDTMGEEQERDAWAIGKVTTRESFAAEFAYDAGFVLNNEREKRRTAHQSERALSQLLDLMEDREKALDLLTTYTKLVRRRAGYDIVTHEWNEGCAGVGCCTDTAELGGAMLIDDTALTADEIRSLM